MSSEAEAAGVRPDDIDCLERRGLVCGGTLISERQHWLHALASSLGRPFGTSIWIRDSLAVGWRISVQANGRLSGTVRNNVPVAAEAVYDAPPLMEAQGGEL